MMGLDTNVLVRFLIRDDEEQFERACDLIQSEAQREEFVCVSLAVLLETEWVLRSRYKLGKEEILSTFSELLSAGYIRFEDEPAIAQALFMWKDSSAQFADCLIGARHWALGCKATATFDQGALKVPGFVAA
ncbi:MAG TPA: type II toxin-antitoxin system VapC family toxin [Steroidobacteraceae bacterium]|nr:type II toxin-antitoxin system VapC family toxin [Steroidobacteraceae bacterium]